VVFGAPHFWTSLLGTVEIEIGSRAAIVTCFGRNASQNTPCYRCTEMNCAARHKFENNTRCPSKYTVFDCTA
jgi:hypothetical protein